MKKIIGITTKHGFKDGSIATQARRNKNGLTDMQLMEIKNAIEKSKGYVAMGIVRHGNENCRYLQIEIEREA